MVGRPLPSNEKCLVLRLADSTVAVRPKYEYRYDILPAETGGCQKRHVGVHNATFEAAPEGMPMGSMITLRLGRPEVDWGKNAFCNHSPLFDKADLAEAEYFYAGDGVVVLRPRRVCKIRLERPGIQTGLGRPSGGATRDDGTFLENLDPYLDTKDIIGKPWFTPWPHGS
jgi:hypothetical protein